MSRLLLLGALLLAAESAGIAASAHGKEAPGKESPLFPFVLPWDDSSPGITDLSGWLPKPAGKDGSVVPGPDGHLYAGGKRVRFHGVDLAFSGNFPTKEDAPKVAARMAKFGINIVRFHIMDMSRFPEGILARDSANTRDLDPEALDRLDFFTSCLKRNGTYTYLCTLNYRPFNAADGLPKEIERPGGNNQGRHVPGFYDPRFLDLQKEYARKLLTHRNAYTGLTYASDPAVAFVEINNENGLIQSWMSGQVDELPEVFLPELKSQWNRWLAKRHPTTAALRRAWGASVEPLGGEILQNAGFTSGTTGWTVERHEAAQATATADDDVPEPLRGGKSVRIDTTRLGIESWHIRFEQTGLKFEAGRPYTLTFWAKADAGIEAGAVIGASMELNHEPWRSVGLAVRPGLTAQWKQYRFVAVLEEGDDNSRLVFDPPMRIGSYWLAGISLRPGGVFGLNPGERIEDGSVGIFTYSGARERSIAARHDWLSFLWETEDRYWQTMYRYMKDDLKVGAMVIGTVVGCSTPNLMAKLDCIDVHAYWQHPIFPGRPWDWENWYVPNRTMVNDAGGVLPGLALRRVLGKPFCITEYGHSAPNTYVSEGSLLRGAYAAFQDWDYISTSRYSHHNDWDLRRIRNYFDIDQHPTKMLTLIPAAAMFYRGDISPAREEVVAPLDREHEINGLGKSWAWELVHAGTAGVPREAALVHRVAIAVEGQKVPEAALAPEKSGAGGTRFVSDTDELVWDLGSKDRGVVTVNSPRSKAVIGFGGGKRFDLGGVIIEPGPTLQEGWSAITMTAMEGDLSSRPVRILVTATGSVENSGMGWKDSGHTSVGGNWGEAPTLVEGIPARFTLPFARKAVKAWALDERGQRKSVLAVGTGPKGRAVVAIGPKYRTLWYEVEAK